MTTTTTRYMATTGPVIGFGSTLAEAVAKVAGYTDRNTGEIILPAGNYVWDGKSGIVHGVLVALCDGREQEQMERDAASLAPLHVDEKTGRRWRNLHSVGVEYNRGSDMLAHMRAQGLA